MRSDVPIIPARQYGENGSLSKPLVSGELVEDEEYPQDDPESSSGDMDDAFEEPSFSFSEDNLIPTDDFNWTNDPYYSNASSSLGPSSFYEKDPGMLYSKTGDEPVDARITVQRTLVVSESLEQKQSVPPSPPPESLPIEERKGRRMSRSITNLARRTKSGRRSSDHSTPGTATPDKSESNTYRMVDALSRTKSNRSESAKRRKSRPGTARTEESEAKGARSFLTRKGSRLAKNMNESNATPPTTIEPTNSPPPSSPIKRPSTPVKGADPATTIATAKPVRQSSKIAPLPGTILRRAQQKTLHSMARKTDELRTVFRTLDADYAKFESKSPSLKGSHVRSSLILFLSKYASHVSNNDLPPDDLERRVQVLSKWWGGLLDMLNEKSGQQLSSLDRSTYLDGISGIMERPEWRQPLSEFSSLMNRRQPAQSASSSDAEQSQDGSEFLLQSVHHNTRNIFVNFLFSQMSFVVDKMSQKIAPATLVTFCGKCCAYATFFCPGIADVLVRLWDVPARNVRRVVESMRMPAPSILAQVSEKVSQRFPQCMQSLAFASSRSTIKSLRSRPVLPMGFEKIPWRDGWLDRWCGKESDLFYVFVKYFHMLVVDFVGEDASKEEFACAPVYVLLRAQILLNIDSTLHRENKLATADLGEVPATGALEEMLNGEASALSMPPIPPNASRLIKANRLIMLMRSFLSETSNSSSTAQRLFADCVCETLQAATASTSLFDQGACFTLCDFLEEVLGVLSKFEDRHKDGSSALNWEFWLNVFIQMVRSDNTLTMIRLIAFLYTAWPTITNDQHRKEELCLKFLLESDTFQSHFSHWCPMVRSYYMRLLSWRVARCDGEPSETDFEVIRILYARLLETWSYFKSCREEAVRRGLTNPSTAPCNPAPGRRLLIIRTDRPIISSPLLESPSRSSSPSDASARFDADDPRHLGSAANSFSASQLFEKLSSTLEQGVDVGRRNSRLLRSISNLRSADSRSSAKGLPDSPPSEASDDATSASEQSSSRASLYEQRPSWPMGPQDSVKSLGIKKPPTAMQTLAEFRFSIEAVDRRPNKAPEDMPLSTPRLPYAAQMLLRTLPDYADDAPPVKPEGAVAARVRYSGRALAEWSMVVNECQNFFERRRSEGVSASKFVETPIMSPEPFKRL